MIRGLAKANRSFRRFDSRHKITRDTLVELIKTARYAASAANKQLIRYFIVYEESQNDAVYSTLSWAGYLKNWKGPQENERPSAYIILLTESTESSYLLYDAGLSSSLILLAANEQKLGGCIFGSVDRNKLQESLPIDKKYDIISVIALGKPVEKVHIIDITKSDCIEYFRDNNQNHYVPKIRVSDLIVN